MLRVVQNVGTSRITNFLDVIECDENEIQESMEGMRWNQPILYRQIYWLSILTKHFLKKISKNIGYMHPNILYTM